MDTALLAQVASIIGAGGLVAWRLKSLEDQVKELAKELKAESALREGQAREIARHDERIDALERRLDGVERKVSQ